MLLNFLTFRYMYNKLFKKNCTFIWAHFTSVTKIYTVLSLYIDWLLFNANFSNISAILWRYILTKNHILIIVWYFTHDVRPCNDFNMKNSNQRLLLVPGSYTNYRMGTDRYRNFEEKKNSDNCWLPDTSALFIAKVRL